MSFGQIYSELRKIRSIHPKYPAPFINTLCFRYLPQQEILPNSGKLRKFHAVRSHSPQIMQNLHHLLTYYTLCFRHLPQQRTLRNSSELCKFHTVHPHSPRIMRNSHHLLTYHILCFRCRPVAENSLKFQRIKQNLLSLPKYPVNYVNSVHFTVQFTHI